MLAVLINSKGIAAIAIHALHIMYGYSSYVRVVTTYTLFVDDDA